MKCGQCGADDTKVIESRDVADGQAQRQVLHHGFEPRGRFIGQGEVIEF